MTNTTAIKTGDKFRDPNMIGSPCVVTAVVSNGQWFEARWMQGAPAYRYATRYAARLIKVS